MKISRLKFDTEEKTIFHDERGFTLIEILMTVVILTVAFAGTASLVATTIRGTQHSKHVTGAVTLVQDKLEGFKNVSYSSITAGSETGIDTEGNAGGQYDRAWTVTESGTSKEIVVTITWPFNGITKTRSMTTIISQ